MNMRVTFESGWRLDGNVPWNVIRKKQHCAWQQQITESNVAKGKQVSSIFRLTTSYTLIIIFPSERKFLPQTLPDQTNHLSCTSFLAELSFYKQLNAMTMDWWWSRSDLIARSWKCDLMGESKAENDRFLGTNTEKRKTSTHIYH